MKIVMIGAGNAATVLSKLIVKNGHEIPQVISRDINHAISLASLCNAKSGTFTDTISEAANLYIISLSDAAIIGLKKMHNLEGKMICHTSGAVPMNSLGHISEKYGVLYPLQTLSKFNDDIPEIPFLVDGNNEVSKQYIIDFANTISDNVGQANDSERMKYHISAVFVHNFANHIFALAENYCKSERLDFPKLFPLMNELIHKVEKFGAIKSQTGPAVREDNITIEKHIEMLASQPQMACLYEILSKSIRELNSKGD